MWFHYDPNWRQFVGCILAINLIVFGEDIPTELHSIILDSLELCVGGEPADRYHRAALGVFAPRSSLHGLVAE